MRWILTCALALAMVVALSSSNTANGALKIRLTEGKSSVTIEDQKLGDANPTVGAVTFIGSVGVFDINTSTGLSKPAIPANSSYAKMDLNSVNHSTGAGTLVIELTDTDFPAFPLGGALIGNIGGTTNGTIEAWGYKNDSNQEFDIINPEAQIHLGPFSPVAFSGTTTTLHGPLPTYSMTQVVKIVHTGAEQTTSFDFECVNIVPAPAGLMLLASSAPAFALAWLRRRKAQQAQTV